MSRVLLIGAALLFGGSAPVVAQAAVDFAAGRPVRVQFPSESQAVEANCAADAHWVSWPERVRHRGTSEGHAVRQPRGIRRQSTLTPRRPSDGARLALQDFAFGA